MKISTIGSGYVGLVTGAIFSEWGHEVLCADVNESKIEKLKKGEVPIFEPGLKELIDRNRASGRLRFTTSNQEAVKHADIIFICVGTPAEERIKSHDQYLKRANLTYVGKVARDIAMYMDKSKIIIDKSTVPVRTGEHVEKTIRRYLSKEIPFWVVSNPEFLREGQAISDCLNPDRIVIGCNQEAPLKVMRELYSRFPERIIETNIWSAELGKLAANGFLALSISY
ncbi:MAG: nucleotide sugar dehydrogenase, partial [Nanoarchaeota archaeon]